jgi:hypothetical protein
MVDKHAYARALRLLSQPDARLVLTYNRSTVSGRLYCIAPRGGRISDELAQSILLRSDVRPLDAGLFPERPQSWCLVKRQQP